MKVWKAISHEIHKGNLPQGYELQAEDVGLPLGSNFGFVLDIDVGKRCWVKAYGFVMENNSQRDKRKGTV